jgi:hypothetical protein
MLKKSIIRIDNYCEFFRSRTLLKCFENFVQTIILEKKQFHREFMSSQSLKKTFFIVVPGLLRPNSSQ